MNAEPIIAHIKNVSVDARADVATGNWDEVMTDALYAACGAATPTEMAEARSEATIFAASL